MANTVNNCRIALAFSGGGYRAAAFSLGVLTLLERVNLLENVYVLSTVSGGTFTGAAYLAGLAKGKQLKDVFKELYGFMTSKDLFDLATKNMPAKTSLITAAAEVYDKEIFKQMQFGQLVDALPKLHVKHFSFNATEFATGNQFRFQWSEEIYGAPPEFKRGIIGNAYFNIKEDEARAIRMGDIIAASSCFPGGFEPIMMPSDFGVTITGDNYPVGLMDGGISDNQGIAPVLLAEDRLKLNYKNINKAEPPANILDLVIVSDVTSPYMSPYRAADYKKAGGWKKWTPKGIYLVNIFVLIASVTGVWIGINKAMPVAIIAGAAVGALSLVVFLLTTVLTRLPKILGVPAAFVPTFGRLSKWPLWLYIGLLQNKVNSMVKMAMDVFLKGGRRAQYNDLYKDKTWQNRLIMNAIYELRENEPALEKKKQSGQLNKSLWPTAEMQKIAAQAASMGTTLWFTKDELQQDMLDDIIACGQFTICWNLLEYLDKIKANLANTTANHQVLIDCRGELEKLWQQFKANPRFMAKPY